MKITSLTIFMFMEQSQYDISFIYIVHKDILIYVKEKNTLNEL